MTVFQIKSTTEYDISQSPYPVAQRIADYIHHWPIPATTQTPFPSCDLTNVLSSIIDHA